MAMRYARGVNCLGRNSHCRSRAKDKSVKEFAMSMTPHDAWQELLNLAEQCASGCTTGTTPELRWVKPNRLVLFNRWQVQARFMAEPGRYSIYLERFGAEL